MANILLGVTGSVAAIKTKELADLMGRSGDVQIAATKGAKYFLEEQDLSAYKVHYDEDEWPQGPKYKIGDPVLHIELRKWADILIIAPLSANTMSKIRYGLCDNLLTCVVRAWDNAKPRFMAPAMNTCMWSNPITQEQLEVLESGWRIINPISKRLACGDEGMGAMESVDKVGKHISRLIGDWE